MAPMTSKMMPKKVQEWVNRDEKLAEKKMLYNWCKHGDNVAKNINGKKSIDGTIAFGMKIDQACQENPSKNTRCDDEQ